MELRSALVHSGVCKQEQFDELTFNIQITHGMRKDYTKSRRYFVFDNNKPLCSVKVIKEKGYYNLEDIIQTQKTLSSGTAFSVPALIDVYYGNDGDIYLVEDYITSKINLEEAISCGEISSETAVSIMQDIFHQIISQPGFDMDPGLLNKEVEEFFSAAEILSIPNEIITKLRETLDQCLEQIAGRVIYTTRDILPRNILITKDKPVIIDFDLSRKTHFFWLDLYRARHYFNLPVEEVYTKYVPDGINPSLLELLFRLSEINLQRMVLNNVAFSQFMDSFRGDTLKLLNKTYNNVETLIEGKIDEFAMMQAELTFKEKILAEKELELANIYEQYQIQDKLLLEKDLEMLKINEQLRLKDELISEKTNEISIILNTKSWRITKPLRWFTHKRHQSFWIMRSGKRYVKENGGGFKGFLVLTFKSFNVLRRYGLIGLKQKIKANILCRNADLIPCNYPLSPITVKSVQSPPTLKHHQVNVDIIICVHNALDDVKRCLDSVLRYTKPPYSLILIDDGSNEETAIYLSQFAEAQGATIIRNDLAKGYTFAANQGLRKANGEYAILLNSDTIVTPNWLDHMVDCAESDPYIGLVGPLSNTASWQSIPRIEHKGDWAENLLPEGMSISEMGALVAKYSARLFPKIPFLNGFCLLIKRAVLNEFGYFDEEAFGKGYGEENDYCLRAIKSGWKLAVADDAYVYHSQSRSYSNERRKLLSEQAGVALAEKHGQQIISQGVQICRFDRVMEGIRARSQTMLRRWEIIQNGLKRWEGKRVIFVLPIMDAGGGGNVVIQEAEAMLAMGLDVRILNLEQFRQAFQKNYPTLNVPVLYAKSEDEVSKLVSSFDAVIATANHSVAWLRDCQTIGRPIRAYYVQDFEPYFFEEGSKRYQIAWESYNLFPDLICITKTQWNLNEVKNQIGIDCFSIGPSVNIDLFRPRPRYDGDWPDRPLRIAAMIRPITPRRNPKLTMEVLKEISSLHGNSIEIILFGCLSDDPDFIALPHDFAWRNEGVLSSPELAWLLNEIDIFVDFSSFQAMGLTAMEAMACGAAVIVPEQGGANSFVKNEKNGLIIDTSSYEVCITALNRLILDKELRTRLQRQALFDIVQYSPEEAAFNMLNIIFS